MAGWLSQFVLDCISSGFGGLNIKSNDTPKTSFVRSSTEIGKLWPTPLAKIIKISGATIGRGFSNACGKAFDGCAEPESLRRTRLGGSNLGTRGGLQRSGPPPRTRVYGNSRTNGRTNFPRFQ